MAGPKTVASHSDLLLYLIMAGVKTRGTVYVRCKIEVHSHNHFCCGTGVNIKYSECVFVALVIQYSKHVNNIMISGLSGFTIFFTHYLIKYTIFGGGVGGVTGREMCVLIFFANFLEDLSDVLSQMYKGLNS